MEVEGGVEEAALRVGNAPKTTNTPQKGGTKHIKHAQTGVFYAQGVGNALNMTNPSFWACLSCSRGKGRGGT